MRNFIERNFLMNNRQLLSIVFCIVFFLSFLSAGAQLAIVKKPGITLGANLLYSMPKGEFGDRYSYGVGGEIYGGIGWGSTYLILTTGVTRYENKPGVANSISTVPIKVGFKKYF